MQISFACRPKLSMRIIVTGTAVEMRNVKINLQLRFVFFFFLFFLLDTFKVTNNMLVNH